MTLDMSAGQDERGLLIVDDDELFLRRLSTAMERRGFQVTIADSVASGFPPSWPIRPLSASSICA